MSVLKVSNLTFSYNRDRVILNDISFAAEAGETIGIIGANGAGKTTLLKTLVGLLQPQAGEINVSGITMSKETLREIRKKIGYVFQDSDSQLFMTTAYEDVAFGPKNYGFDADEVKRRTLQAMQLTQSEYLADRPIHKMSGGEKKLISIASILSMEPDIIIMDEPTNSLDPKNRRNLMNVLKTLPCTKLIASHDLDMVWECCDRVLLFGGGKIVAGGPVKEILVRQELLTENSLELPLSAQLYMLKK